MGLKGDLGTLRQLKANLRALPVTLAHDVSKRAAPAMTDLTQAAFSAATTVYGESRPTSKVNGARLSLRRTGATQGGLKFRADGTVIRCVLGPKWSRYLIGNYGILPNGALPVSWSRRLAQVVAETKAAL